MAVMNFDNLPYLIDKHLQIVGMRWDTFRAILAAKWWGIHMKPGCAFWGYPHFNRHPLSRISIGEECRFRSHPRSNLIGINRPCILSTLAPGAEIAIGSGCGFSGTVISSAVKITLGEKVRCGANTLITDTDWHRDDPRSGPDAPVVIEKGVWLGVNVTVLKGVTIGENTLVASGSIVTCDLPPNVIAGGVPAKEIRALTK